MNLNYLATALNEVSDPPLLINAVSRRFRQLASGQRPLVKPDHVLMSYADMALKEIGEQKLVVERLVSEAGDDDDTVPAERSSL